MKIARKTVGWAALALAMVFLAAGCQKETFDTDAAFSADKAFSDNTFEEISDIVDDAQSGDLSSYKTGTTGGNCATIILDDTNEPEILTIDFGDENCAGNDGKMRRGKIVVTFIGEMREQDSWREITFEDFYVNDHHVLGTKRVENMGLNEAGNVWFAVTVSGQIVLADEKGAITRSGERIREWVEGYSTEERTDDVFQITGVDTGTRPNGKSFTAEIISPLVKRGDCKWIVSGTIQITPEGDDTHVRTLDFGDGTCDEEMTGRCRGKLKKFTLRR